MVLTVSRQQVINTAKFGTRVVVFLLLALYILPKLLIMLWQVNSVPNIQDENLLEKPLRVMINMFDIS